MDKYTRQKNLVDANIFKTPVAIIGAGGIGSFTALTLAKMGFMYITVYDGDTVEEHNLPNQFYRHEDIGRFKVTALANLIETFEKDLHIASIPGYWTQRHKLKGLVIMAVDSMQTREEIYWSIKDQPSVIGFIDGRMGGQQAEVYSVMRGKADFAYYESRLWKDSEVDPIRCTEKAIIYNVLWIASIISNQARLLLEGLIYKRGLLMDFQNNEMVEGVKDVM